MNKFTYTVTSEDEHERIDKLLVGLKPSSSRHQIQLAIKEGKVTVNDRQVKANYKCRARDVILWQLPELEAVEIEPEDIPLSIVYEDEDLIVLNKPAGILVHPTNTVHSGTLVNALLNHSDHLSSLSGDSRPGIVHRLDRDTSGVMLVCKHDQAHESLKEQFQARTVKRVYEAISHGYIAHDHGRIRAPIGRHPKKRLKMAVVPNGKEAETSFTVYGRNHGLSYLQCQLITGRTHQIRVHLSYIGHPIIGDPLYSSKPIKELNHQALFAKSIGFKHPTKQEYMEFTIERPEFFQNLLDRYDLIS